MRLKRCLAGRRLRMAVLGLILTGSLTSCGSSHVVFEQPGTGGKLTKPVKAEVATADASGKTIVGTTILPAGTKVLVADKVTPEKLPPVPPAARLLPGP